MSSLKLLSSRIYKADCAKIVIFEEQEAESEKVVVDRKPRETVLSYLPNHPSRYIIADITSVDIEETDDSDFCVNDIKIKVNICAFNYNDSMVNPSIILAAEDVFHNEDIDMEIEDREITDEKEAFFYRFSRVLEKAEYIEKICISIGLNESYKIIS